MTALETLRALKERLEAATGPDRELDDAIRTALRPEKGWAAFEPLFLSWDGLRCRAMPFTASIDAALSLKDAVLPGWNIVLWDSASVWTCDLNETGKVDGDCAEHSATSDTIPLAICLAVVSAKIAEMGAAPVSSDRGPG